MGFDELSTKALELSPQERLELARILVESVGLPPTSTEALQEGIKRIDDLASGRVKGLTEEEFRAALE